MKEGDYIVIRELRFALDESNDVVLPSSDSEGRDIDKGVLLKKQDMSIPGVERLTILRNDMTQKTWMTGYPRIAVVINEG